MKLYWKIYLVLVFTTLAALVLSVWISFSVLPDRIERERVRTMDSFEAMVLSGDYSSMEGITALADSMGIEVRLVRADHPFIHSPGSAPPPQQQQEMEWRGIRLIHPPFGDMNIVASVRMRPPRFILLVLIALGLFLAQAIALGFGLRPVFRKLTLLTRATDDFGRGQLTARYPEHGRGDELDRLGRAFNTMAERINNLLSAHNELLNSVAHELRTPMARLGFALELAGENPDSSAEKLKLMERDLFELDTLVSELLEFNRIGSSEPAMERVDIGNICHTAADGERVHNTAVRIEVDTSGSVSSVTGDGRLLQRAVSNLVRNAVSHARSRVSIRVSSTQGQLLVTVEDDGTGFSPGMAERAVSPFIKGENSKGAGLGLSIVQRIAEKHNGRLSLRNSQSGGAVAELSIPL